MDRVFLITTTDGKTLPATNIRTYEDGGQHLALIYRNKLKTLKSSEVASVTFGPPPADPPPATEAPTT